MHHKSRRSDKIDRFWSHSWHGAKWSKVLTLLVLYNGKASMLLGTLAAFVMSLLYAFGYLPELVDRMHHVRSVWSLSTGFLVSTLTFILWKPRQAVFFDRICINQEDSQLKSSAIFSLAGILRNSKEMLVLWDPSWCDRLWCLFELAAFLKCKKAEGSKQVLIVRPTLVGPCSIAVFLTVWAAMLGLIALPWDLALAKTLEIWIWPLVGFMGCGFAVGFWALTAFRRFFRSVDVLEDKLGRTNFDTVRSACCDSQHVSPQGNPMLCDREVLKQCVATWFGNMEAFEESIHADVLDTIVEELRHSVFTTGWIVQVSVPILWVFMDMAAATFRLSFPYLRSGYGRYDFSSVVIELAIVGLVLWLFCGPRVFHLVTFLSRKCSKAYGTFCDILVTVLLLLVVLLLILIMCVAYVTVWLLLRETREDSLRRSLVCTVVPLILQIPFSLCAWRRRKQRKVPATEPPAAEHRIPEILGSDQAPQESETQEGLAQRAGPKTSL